MSTPHRITFAAFFCVLLAGSPGIDAGNSAAPPEEYPVDFDGNPRAVDNPATPDIVLAVLAICVDMGAFE